MDFSSKKIFFFSKKLSDFISCLVYLHHTFFKDFVEEISFIFEIQLTKSSAY